MYMSKSGFQAGLNDKLSKFEYALLRQPEDAPRPSGLLIPWPRPVRRLTLLSPETELPFTQTEDGIRVHLPDSLTEEDWLAPAIRME